MAENSNDKAMSRSGLQGPVIEFSNYCQEQKNARQQQADFNEQQFDQAVALVLEKLQELEVEE